MLVDTPLQRRSRIKDSQELALSDWLSTARFAEDDIWPRKWAEAYVSRSIDMIHDWLVDKSIRFMPVVNWAEEGFQARQFCTKMAYSLGNRP